MIIDLAKHTPKKEHKYLLDANIWMFLFCPIGNALSTKIQKYSNFYNAILRSNASTFITFNLLSEFINRYVRLDFELCQNGNRTYEFKRDYRDQSQEYITTIESIAYTVSNQILLKTIQLPDKFDQFEADILFKDNRPIDFNDSHTAWIAQKENMFVVTDDGDFGQFKNEIDILTINWKLLNK